MNTNNDLERSANKLVNELQYLVSNGLRSKLELLNLLARAQREIEGPGMFLSRVRFAPLLNMCQLIAVETGLIHAIATAGGNTLTASSLAATVKQEESLIARVMRLLTAHGICEEVAPSTYTSNAIAELLDTPEQVGATRNMVELLFPIAGQLVKQIRSTKGLSEFPDTVDSTTPFRATYGGQSMFQFFETNEEHKVAFDLYMTGRTSGFKRYWHDILPVRNWILSNDKDDAQSVLVVDVGGGRGHNMISFRRSFPNAVGRVIVQDLPGTIQSIVDPFEGVEFMVHDFFYEQPIRGARIYYLSAILHNWSDTRCKEILMQTARAMLKGYSTLLIEEMVLKDIGESMRGASRDILMFMMPEGIERSLSDFGRLLGAAGLQIINVWAGDEGLESVIEVELA